MKKVEKSIFSKEFILPAIKESFLKLNPKYLLNNPVMLSVEIGAIITSIWSLKERNNLFFNLNITVWLWITVLFSNFSESLAEIRGKARAESLKVARSSLKAKRLKEPSFDASYEIVDSQELRKGDLVLVEEGDIIPGDGEIIKGVALINESAVTGESAPVIREEGGDRSAVTGGTKVISDKIIIRITANPGETFLDKMISLIENAKRRKTPNEIALEILIITLTFLFFIVVLNTESIGYYSSLIYSKQSFLSPVILVSLFVCLAPTTIAALLPAVAIAGMDRLFKKNVVALSGRAIEAAGNVSILLLDKTGTITLGNRQAAEVLPVKGVTKEELALAAMYSSIADTTPEGKSIVVLVKNLFNIRPKEVPPKENILEFSAKTKMSGTKIDGKWFYKGAFSSIVEKFQKENKEIPEDLEQIVAKVAKEGGTPLVVATEDKILGVVYLKDILKGGIKERIENLRKVGIKSIMITGDNPLTAAFIASEAGLDDFLAEAKPEDKLNLIKRYQQEGYIVAMSGDGTNDAPALAQADVAVAMNSGTEAAREAANIIDLDNDPTKLIDIVETGKQMLMTRGALTTFSIANDLSKYFTIIPAALSYIYPELNILNIMDLKTPYSAILSAVIFNAIIIPLLTPLALKGVKYIPMPAQSLFLRNFFIYGVGGVIAPFIGIKLIDILINFIGGL